MAPGEVPAVFPDKRPLSGHLIHPKIHPLTFRPLKITQPLLTTEWHIYTVAEVTRVVTENSVVEIVDRKEVLAMLHLRFGLQLLIYCCSRILLLPSFISGFVEIE